MRRFVKILVAVILAFGWSVTVIAKEKGWVTEDQRLYALSILIGLFLLKEVISLRQKPVTKAEVAKRQDVIEDYLGTVLSRYYTELNLPADAGLPAVRINVALLTHIGFFRRRMMITYTSAPAEAYTAAELQMKFVKGEDGVIGDAWRSGKPAFFPTGDGQPLLVSEDKIDLLKKIRSVLSVPLKLEDKVVGVLSMDSEFPIETTRFSQYEIVKSVQAAAKKLEPLCFASGVKYD
jgi:putative methionine-R-sulfoxide reductase with GAF domain